MKRRNRKSSKDKGRRRSSSRSSRRDRSSKRDVRSSRKKRSFQSKKLAERIKRGQKRAKGMTKNVIKDNLDIPIWRPKDGSHIIDIIPYYAGKNDPLNDEGDPTYTYEYWVHTNVGANNSMFICPAEMQNKKCPICEHRQKLKEDGNDDAAGKLWPKRRNLYNIVCYDRGEADKGVQVWDVSWHYFEKLVMAISEKQDRRGGTKTINFADPESGKSISFTIEPAKSKNDYPSFVGHAFDDRDYEIEDDILDETQVLDEIVTMPDYEAIDTAYWGDKDRNERSSRGRSRGSSRRPAKDDTPDIDDLLDDLEDCESLEDLEDFIEENDIDVKVGRRDDEEDVRDKIKDWLEDEYGASGDDDKGGDDDGGGDYTEDEIINMSEKKLARLIDDEGLDIDPDEFDDVEDLQDEVLDALGL